MRLRRHIIGRGNFGSKVYIYIIYVCRFGMVKCYAGRAVMVVGFIGMVVGYHDEGR